MVLLLVVRHLPLVLLVLLVLLMLLLMPLPLVLLLLLMLLREMHHGSSGGAARGWRALPPRHVTRSVGGGWGFYGVGGLGIIICLAGVGIAAFFLVLDFEAIKQGVAMGLPERESWRMSFGLLVTLVWIYLEFLRLFAILSGRD